MKGPLNSPLDSPPTRSLFVFTEKSVLNPALTLNFRICRHTTNIMAFCFVVGTEVESSVEVESHTEMSISKLKEIIYEKRKNKFENKGFDPSDLYLWKVNIPVTENAKLKTLKSRFHDISDESTIIEELGGVKLTPFDNVGDIFEVNPKEISVMSNEIQRVPVSESEFQRMRKYNQLYVDKTFWLTQLWLNNGHYFILWP
ncbi:16856_t:CDS:2 [Funneliformis mosseae]|uniref:16856_t:CDS:1 n=1 Tax=Funneliformis mosseae TaxID=27381 RepID=A0A9N9I190_FUNMO|nr:16856_t:CDS:2 [Funneliformis mosseae]